MNQPRHRIYGALALSILATVLLTGTSTADASPRSTLIEGYADQAKSLDQTFVAFSAERGQSLLSSTHTTGKPDTPSCATCHTQNPQQSGQTRAGKEIKPMALSRTPDRYSDPAKVEKWFLRNCNSVLGRECTPMEKGNFLTFMTTQ